MPVDAPPTCRSEAPAGLQPPGDRAAARGRWPMLAMLVLALAGVAVSVELTRIHILVHTDPDYHSVCAVSEGLDCESVAASPYSVFAGLPVSVWGILGYLIVASLTGWGLCRARLHDTWPLGLLLAGAALMVAVSAALAFVSYTRIDSLCLYCTASYAINLGLLAAAAAAARAARCGPLALLRADLAAVRAHPCQTAPLPALAAIAVVVLHALVPSYWRSPGWTDLPPLTAGTDADGGHWIGAEAPAVTIVEYSDYQCPHCRAAHHRMRQLVGQHPDRVRLVHRHLPLDRACHPAIRERFHDHACRFAEAAECAGRQGRFWDMNDALFSVQERKRADHVDPVRLAVQLGLDRGAFASCLDQHAAAPAVRGDIERAMALGLRGTPSYVIGDRVHLGEVPRALLERYLAGAPPRRGPPPR